MPSLRTWLFLAGGGAILTSLILGRKRIAVTVSKLYEEAGRAAFAAVLPSRARPYLDALLDAGREFDVSPFTIYGLIDRESLWGDYLKPRGPAGVGDITPRWKTEDEIARAYPWARAMNLITGKTRMRDRGGQSVTEFEVAPPKAGGAAYAGWGFGLGQLDFASFKDWIESGAWKDPTANIRKSTARLSNAIRFFKLPKGTTVVGDPRPLEGRALLAASLSAYNAGETAVLKAIAQEKAPDSVTTGKDYARNSMARADAVADKFRGKVG